MATKHVITGETIENVFNSTVSKLINVKNPTQADYIKAQKEAVKEAGFAYSSYVRVMKQRFEDNPDNWLEDGSDYFLDTEEVVESPFIIAVNNRNERSGILSLYAVELTMSGRTVTCINHKYDDEIGVSFDLSYEDFNLRFTSIN